MPLYRVERRWSVTEYYSDTVEVEADSEREARREAVNMELDYGSGSDDSETNEVSVDEIEAIECTSGDDGCECDYCTQNSPAAERPTYKPNCSMKVTRNLPDWF